MFKNNGEQQKDKKSNKVKTFWGDAFKSIKEIEDSKYDKIFVDLNDDQYCIDLAKKNMRGLKRILKKGGIITMEKPINISNMVLLNNKAKPVVKIDKKIKDKKKTIKQKTKSKKK